MYLGSHVDFLIRMIQLQLVSFKKPVQHVFIGLRVGCNNITSSCINLAPIEKNPFYEMG